MSELIKMSAPQGAYFLALINLLEGLEGLHYRVEGEDCMVCQECQCLWPCSTRNLMDEIPKVGE
jgi:hypothetical protein